MIEVKGPCEHCGSLAMAFLGDEPLLCPRCKERELKRHSAPIGSSGPVARVLNSLLCLGIIIVIALGGSKLRGCIGLEVTVEATSVPAR